MRSFSQAQCMKTTYYNSAVFIPTCRIVNRDCIYADISDHHLLQCRHQYILLLGSDADDCVWHCVVDAVHYGNDGDWIS